MDLSQVKITESKDQLIKSSKSKTTKNKGGRPKLDDEFKRKNKIILYFTDEELQTLKDRSGKKAVSSYIRDRILSSLTRL